MTLTRREQWERRWTRPMMVAATVFLASYAWPILDPGLSDQWVLVCHVATWITWGLFFVDYVVRVVLSTQRWRFVRTHVFDLLVVLLPLFRPLGLLRLVAALSVLDRYVGTTLRGRVAIYIAGAVSLVIFVAALAALQAERGADGATITAFDEAVWRAMTTRVTVGYGDLYPITTTGRGVAVGLMLCGIALIGVVTASFASWLSSWWRRPRRRRRRR